MIILHLIILIYININKHIIFQKNVYIYKKRMDSEKNR